MKLIKIFFILLVLLCSPNAFAGGKEYLQTGAPCNVDVTKSTEDEGPGETECPYCPMAGSSFVNLKWDLSNRGGCSQCLLFYSVRQGDDWLWRR